VKIELSGDLADPLCLRSS